MAHGHGHEAEAVPALAALVLTVSDGVSAGSRNDESGALLAQRLSDMGFKVERQVVADEPEAIASIVAQAADGGARLIVSSGGTGLGPRDRTPEAVTSVADYLVPGLGEAMRTEGRAHTPLASLSRSLGAVRGRTLILCLPGSPSGASESLDALDTILAHALETLAGRTAHARSSREDAQPRSPA